MSLSKMKFFQIEGSYKVAKISQKYFKPIQFPKETIRLRNLTIKTI